MEPFVPWETYPDVLDTFFAVTERPASPYVLAKRSTRYYHYLDPDVPNGFTSYYSVVASDHAYERRRKRHEDYWWWWVYYWVVVGYGVESDPGNNQHLVVPSPAAQTAENRELMGANIYVYPNPATTAALEEFQKQPPSLDNPTGVRVVFNNLPKAYNTIKIFTTAGDLIQTVTHDGRSEGGAASWNLMSRNGQEVVSGIYLYVVQSDDTRFETFRDKFVVIR